MEATAVRTLLSSLALSALLAMTISSADAQKPANALPPPAVRPAIDGILAAFQTHPLVAIGNSEDSAQEEDFYAALMRDPRFARDVGNVVVEFGSAAHQDTMDRYLNGQDVSFSDLRKVWSDVVGFNIPYAIGYVNFFVQVRAVNLKLPSAQRIHVWLGEPPINWSKVTTSAQFFSAMTRRDTHPAELIEKEILAKNKKALVIYGDGHFYHDSGVLKLVAKEYPKSTFIVEMYTGFVTKSCTTRFEQSIEAWSPPALATPVRESSLAGRLYKPDCDVVPKNSWRFGPKFTETQKSEFIADMERNLSGLNGDALLYLGKAAGLTQSPFEPSIYLDPDYRREENRRAKLGFGFFVGDAPLTDAFVQLNPVSPQYIHHY